MGAMSRQPTGTRDLTVLAVPAYGATIALEYVVLRRRARERGPSAGDYERRDTLASLAMGTASLFAPLVAAKLLRPITPGRGRYGRVLVTAALGAVAATTAADAVVRRTPVSSGAIPDPSPADGLAVPSSGAGPGAGPGSASVTARPPSVVTERLLRRRRLARRVAAAGGVAAVSLGGLAVATTWASRTTPDRLWRRRVLPSLGTGPLAVALAVAGWDFIYYWNHRISHESRFLWASHVVHHSSERYNLSTALRQPVADAFGTYLPYGALCLFGIPPEAVATARGVNLLYQYWIHTETIGSLGPPEAVLNSASHHRVHHGSNRQYLDRNHGSILIVWDRLFGTFEPEDERVVYGLTTNIDTFNPIRIATHEFADMLRDVAGSDLVG